MSESLASSESPGHRVLKGLSWNLAASILDRLLALAVAVLVARTLGKEDYGRFGFLFATVMMVSQFTAGGFGPAASRLTAELRVKDPARLRRVVALQLTVAAVAGLLLTAVLMVLSSYLSEHAIRSAGSAGLVRWTALALIPLQLMGVINGVVQGLEAFDLQARLRVLVGLGRLAAVAAGLWLDGLRGAVWGLAISYWFEVLLLGAGAWVRLESGRPAWADFWEPLAERGTLFSTTLPAMMTAQVSAPSIWLCQAFLMHQPGGAAAMGEFNAANQLRMIVQFIPGRIAEVVQPAMSGAVSGGRIGESRGLFRSALLWTVVIGLAGGGVVVLLGDRLLGIYGSDFSKAATVLLVLVLAGMLQAMGDLAGNALVALGRMWFRFIAMLAYGVALIAIGFVCIPSKLAVGLALGDGGGRLLFLALSLAPMAHFLRKGEKQA